MKPKNGEEHKLSSEQAEVDEELLNRYQEKIKKAVSDYSVQIIEDTNRQMTSLSNQSMMDISELADQVLEDIKKNHKECVFLYDMIEDKGQQLKNYISDCTKQLIAVQDTIQDTKHVSVQQKTVQSEKNKEKNQAQSSLLKHIKQPQEPHNFESDMEGAKETQERNRKIISMYQSGMSAIDIAKKLDMGIGEVQVSIDLFQGEEKNEI